MMTADLRPAPANFIPRSQRPKVWGQRASEAARANGAKALAQAEAAIAAVWNSATWRPNELKLDLERAMARGAFDIHVRDRYRNIALSCPLNLAGAIVEIERSYRGEVRDRRHRERYGLPTRSPAHEQRLFHARLFLRWLRRYGDADAFPEILETLTLPLNWRHELQAAE